MRAGAGRVMRASADEVDAAATNILVIATFWMNYAAAARGDKDERASIRDGIVQGDDADRAVPARRRTRAPQYADPRLPRLIADPLAMAAGESLPGEAPHPGSSPPPSIAGYLQSPAAMARAPTPVAHASPGRWHRPACRRLTTLALRIRRDRRVAGQRGVSARARADGLARHPAHRFGWRLCVPCAARLPAGFRPSLRRSARAASTSAAEALHIGPPAGGPCPGCHASRLRLWRTALHASSAAVAAFACACCAGDAPRDGPRPAGPARPATGGGASHPATGCGERSSWTGFCRSWAWLPCGEFDAQPAARASSNHTTLPLASTARQRDAARSSRPGTLAAKSAWAAFPHDATATPTRATR